MHVHYTVLFKGNGDVFPDYFCAKDLCFWCKFFVFFGCVIDHPLSFSCFFFKFFQMLWVLFLCWCWLWQVRGFDDFVINSFTSFYSCQVQWKQENEQGDMTMIVTAESKENLAGFVDRVTPMTICDADGTPQRLLCGRPVPEDVRGYVRAAPCVIFFKTKR